MTNADATPSQSAPPYNNATTAMAIEECKEAKLMRFVEALIKMDNEQRLIKEMTAEVSDDDYRDDLMV